MKRDIHVFDNGIKVYDDHLIPIQRNRYKQRNVHEAEEEDIFIQIVQSIPQDGCYINIGSAIGYYPLLAKRLVPGLTVHAIEPLARHRDFFIENIALNGLEQSSFIIHTEGISSSDGRAEFLTRGYGSVIVRNNLSTPAGTQTIVTRSLDSLCEEIGRVVDLCQMDVQGLELDVLAGAQNVLQSGNVKIFLIGTHSEKLHGHCINALTDKGYVIEYDNYHTKEQPDGILVASKGCQRPSISKKSPDIRFT